ncbi:MAG: hypothetical protein HY055_16060 [Magnetospirillum sp.]|nr:hypothetical protein [Magnetospirillum sp.]
MSTDITPDFSLAYYASIITRAREAGYRVVTLAEFISLGCPDQRRLILRHDLDTKPASLAPMLEVERDLGVASTVYVRVMGPEYNLYSYPLFTVLREAAAAGTEIGLHTNFAEFAAINNLDPYKVLESEVSIIRSFFDIAGISCHRDINYIHNSLPALEDNFAEWGQKLNISYQAYDKYILGKTVYVNEGLSPHLCWRSLRPEEVIPSCRSIYLLTHSHWWYRNHPFEVPS